MDQFYLQPFIEDPQSILYLQENQLDDERFNQNFCMTNQGFQHQNSMDNTSMSTTQQRESENHQYNQQSSLQGSTCQAQTSNYYLSSDNNNSNYCQDTDQPEAQNIECQLNEYQQELNETNIQYQPQNDNNYHNQNNNLYYLQENNTNYQQNTNQICQYLDTNICHRYQSNYQSISFENYQQQQIHNENHCLLSNPSSLNNTEGDYCPYFDESKLNEYPNSEQNLVEVSLNLKKKLSPTKQKAILKNKKAYSDQYTCKVCKDKSFANHGAFNNHVSDVHPGCKASDLSKKPNKTLGRPPKHKTNQSHQNS
ncbi:hypothetical protein ABPG74_013624 [Tetrahymena malaccensis]